LLLVLSSFPVPEFSALQVQAYEIVLKITYYKLHDKLMNKNTVQ